MLRDRETSRRENFLQSTGPFLPPCFVTTFLPTLFQKPPRLAVDAAAATPELPDLRPPKPAGSNVSNGDGATNDLDEQEEDSKVANIYTT